jgi:hypothetical protein
MAAEEVRQWKFADCPNFADMQVVIYIVVGMLTGCTSY